MTLSRVENFFEIIPATSLPKGKDKTFTYFFDKPLEKGAEVLIPFRNRILRGIIFSASKKPKFQTKKIIKIIDEKALNNNQLKLIDFMAERFAASKSLLAKIFLPFRPKNKFRKKTQDDFAASPSQPQFFKKLGLAGAGRHSLLIAPFKKRFEHYKKFLNKAAKNNETVLFLCPDLITLFEIFNWAKEFLPPKKIAFIYRSLQPNNFFAIWQKIKNGQIKFIFGLKNALFLNIPKLDFIIFEDSGNESYYQKDQKPYYNSEEIVLKLAELYGTKIVFGASLPKTETYFKAKQKKWKIQNFWPKKISAQIINMQDEFQKKNFILSDQIQEELKDLENKKALLLVSRRGKARSLLCRDCDFIFKCPACNLPLVLHSEKGQDKEIICHTCGYTESSPAFCPNCGGPRIKYKGAGSERVEQEAKKLFPKLKISRFDQESLKGVSLKEVIKKFKEKETDVLIGTPLLIKPFLLPKISFSAIISLDQNLLIPEFRNLEKIVRILLKLNEFSNKIFIQTRFPENEIFKELKNFDLEKFYKKELETRKIFNYPPFSHLAKIAVKEKTEKKASARITGLKKRVENFIKKEKISGLEVMGPVSPLKPQKGGFHYSQLVLRGPLLKIQKIIFSKIPGDKNIKVQIDPENLL